MLDLVYKDIVQGRRTLLLYLVLAVVFGLVMSIGVTNVSSILAMMMVFAVYGFAIRSTYDEEKNGALLFLKGLPLSDTAIVSSKFLSTLAVAVVLAVFFQGVAVFAEVFVRPRFAPGASAGSPVDLAMLLRGSLANISIVLAVVLVLTGVYLTMFFWMGYARASAYHRFVMLGVFAFVSAGASAIQRLSPEPPVWLAALWQSRWVPPLVLAAGLSIYALGCAVSVARVRVKDWS